LKHLKYIFCKGFVGFNQDCMNLIAWFMWLLNTGVEVHIWLHGQLKSFLLLCQQIQKLII